MPESSEKTALCTNSSFLDWFSANQHGKDKKLVLQQQGHIFRLIGCNEAAFLFLRALDLSFFPLPFFFLHPVLLPTLSSFFCMELWLAKLLGKRQI